MKTLIDQARPLAYVLLFGTLVTVSFSISLFEITSSIFLALWLIDAALRRRGRVFSGIWPALLGVYVLMNVLSLIPAHAAYPAVKGAFRVLRWALLTLAVTDVIDTEEKFLHVSRAILAVVLFIGVDALTQALTGVEILRGRSQTAFYGAIGRVTGPFPHANDFSAYLCLAVFACAAVAADAIRSRNRGRSIFAFSALALAIACLALTYSRGAWLAVIAVLALWAVLRRSFWPVLLVAVFVAAAYVQSPFLFQRRMGSFGQALDGTVTERRLLWGESLQMIRAKPLLGFGVNTYSANVERFKDKNRPTDRQYAHNGYLQIAAETGLLGLAAFLAPVLFFLFAGAPVFFSSTGGAIALPAQGLWLGLVALLIQSATDTTLQSLLLTGHLWLWMGLGWAAYRLLQAGVRSGKAYPAPPIAGDSPLRNGQDLG